jgi:hypothetical protein
MQLKVVLEKLFYPIEPLLIKVDCCGFPSICIVVTNIITMTIFYNHSCYIKMVLGINVIAFVEAPFFGRLILK